MNKNNIVLVILLLFLVNVVNAQEFYTFLGKSEKYLVNKLGAAHNTKMVENIKVCQYFYGDDENTVFSLKFDAVFMAIRTIRCYNLSTAKTKSSSLILYYLSIGFTKQGSEAGMTILKKGIRVLNIGYINNNDGTYSAMATAF